MTSAFRYMLETIKGHFEIEWWKLVFEFRFDLFGAIFWNRSVSFLFFKKSQIFLKTVNMYHLYKKK